MPPAAEITVLSGAAVEPALIAAAGVFRSRTGTDVRIAFATTPDIRRLIGAGETPDVVIAPPATLDQLANEPLMHGKGRELGFMPVVQILHWRGRGLQLVGPLPDDIQNYTTYAAAPASGSRGGRAFVRFLGTPEAKAISAGEGIE